MRLKGIVNLFKLTRLKKLRQDFKNPMTALLATSGVLSQKHILFLKDGGKMSVNRDDLPAWQAYFKSNDCRVDIKKGLFHITPKYKNHPPYCIKGMNNGLTHNPKRWVKNAPRLVLELEQLEQKVFSQHGEDGIINAILAKIPTQHHYLVEFGAYDGKDMSNSRSLIKNNNWSGLLIEGDSHLFKKLNSLYLDNKKIITENKILTKNNINQTFHNAEVPVDFDFLCIDVDGPDYYLWQALTDYHPSIVMVEYNSIISPEKEYVASEADTQKFSGTSKEGASLLSFCKLGQEKGYIPIYTELSGSNLFFIHQRHQSLFDTSNITASSLYQPPQFGVIAGGQASNGRGYL